MLELYGNVGLDVFPPEIADIRRHPVLDEEQENPRTVSP